MHPRTARVHAFSGIVVLKPSPHKHGASGTLANYFVRGGQDAGNSVRVLDRITRYRGMPVAFRVEQYGALYDAAGRHALLEEAL